MKSRLLSFIRPVQRNMYHIFDPKGLKFLIRLRLGLSHLNEHKFCHNFQDCLNPLCSSSLEIEDTSHYLLHCQHLSNHRIDLMNSVKSVIINFESRNDNRKRDILLYGHSRFDENKNKIILEQPQTIWKILKDFLDPFLNNNLANYSPINTCKPETIKPLLV